MPRALNQCPCPSLYIRAQCSAVHRVLNRAPRTAQRRRQRERARPGNTAARCGARVQGPIGARPRGFPKRQRGCALRSCLALVSLRVSLTVPRCVGVGVSRCGLPARRHGVCPRYEFPPQCHSLTVSVAWSIVFCTHAAPPVDALHWPQCVLQCVPPTAQVSVCYMYSCSGGCSHRDMVCCSLWYTPSRFDLV